MTVHTDRTGPADTRVMGIVRSALRRDLARAGFLHRHHESEDEHLYPIVRARNPEARPLLDRMDADHRAISESR